MNTEAIAVKRSKAHIRYETPETHKIVPGVTTVLNVLNKAALVPWANNLGLQGINVRNYVDTLATVGTYAHEMILCHLKGEKFDPKDRPADLVDKAENCFLSYLAWEKGHEIIPILCEIPLVSEKWQYGGTIDFYGSIDGIMTLKDFKTGKAIYDEYLYQVAAYRMLLEEAGRKVDAVGILQIGRDETEGFSERVITDCRREWEIFKHCLAIYQLRRWSNRALEEGGKYS